MGRFKFVARVSGNEFLSQVAIQRLDTGGQHFSSLEHGTFVKGE